MAKTVQTFRAVERWCGKEPERGSDSLLGLWEENGPAAVPFDPAGAELLIDILDEEFSDRDIRLRAVDILELTVNGLIDAIPDLVQISMALTIAGRRVSASAAAPAALTPAASSSETPRPSVRTPSVVTLSDETIKRLVSELASALSPQPEKPRDKMTQTKPARTEKRQGRRAGRRS